MIFVVGSILAGFAPTMGVLISARAVQGIGVGGLTALVQVVIAVDGLPARARPLLRLPRRGLRASARSPARSSAASSSTRLARLALVLLRRHPVRAAAFVRAAEDPAPADVKREVKIDYPGAGLIVGGVSALLIWVSLAGKQFDWVSWPDRPTGRRSVWRCSSPRSYRARAPRSRSSRSHLFRDRTVAPGHLRLIFVGVAMFGGTVFLSQYFQIARGDVADRTLA